MAAAVEEQAELARVPGGLLINFGTVDDMDGMLAAGFNANLNRKPIVFDPVGIGATEHRRNCAASKSASCFSEPAVDLDSVPELLDAWQVTVIKGNAAEISAVVKSDEVQRFRDLIQLQCLTDDRSRDKVSTVWDRASRIPHVSCDC